MTNISYVQNYLEKLRNSQPAEKLEEQLFISSRVTGLAAQIKAWHDKRPIPDRWQPVQLGRLAAQFNTSREITAAALEYSGWVERRIKGCSCWQPK